jgi:GNAT superfamily N-acetyltransferase
MNITNCKFKKTGLDDLNYLIELRVEFIKDIHPEYDNSLVERIKYGATEYLMEHIQNNTYSGFLGFVDGEIVCSAGLLIYYLPPLRSEQPRKTGHILNCFTRLPHRGKGYGFGLIEFIRTSAKEDGISRLFLNATPSGYSLYKRAGFTESEDKAMCIEL